NQPFVTQGKEGPLHLTMTLSRSKLEQLVDGLIQKTLKPVELALKDAKMKVSDIDEIVMVGGMTRMPKVVEAVTKFFGKEPNKSVNPDEVVAIGAAVQAGVLGGEVKDVLLLDVTPLTLGLETLGSVSTPLIPRNSTIPTSKSQVFSTASDNQTQVEINVLQGERPMAPDNKSLGRFVLDGIPPAPRGVPQVEVIFDIDASGMLHVKAKDKASGKEQSIKITGSTGLSDEEIQKMTKEAEVNAKEDEEKKGKADARNQADSLIFTAEKSLKDAGEKIAEDLKKDIEEKIAALKSILDTGSKEDLEVKTQELSEVLQKIGEAMNKTEGAKETASNAAGAKGSNETQETEEAKEEKKDKAQEGEVV
ncbi:MAG: Hsp70 family protein, partial [Patescibacteria group bacterium]